MLVFKQMQKRLDITRKLGLEYVPELQSEASLQQTFDQLG